MWEDVGPDSDRAEARDQGTLRFIIKCRRRCQAAGAADLQGSQAVCDLGLGLADIAVPPPPMSTLARFRYRFLISFPTSWQSTDNAAALHIVRGCLGHAPTADGSRRGHGPYTLREPLLALMCGPCSFTRHSLHEGQAGLVHSVSWDLTPVGNVETSKTFLQLRAQVKSRLSA